MTKEAWEKLKFKLPKGSRVVTKLVDGQITISAIGEDRERDRRRDRGGGGTGRGK